MLSPEGRLKGDLTVFNWGDGAWWIMGSYYLRQWHLRWFQGHVDDGVDIRDISDATIGFSLSGPTDADGTGDLAYGAVNFRRVNQALLWQTDTINV